MSVLNYQIRLHECEELVLAMADRIGLTTTLAHHPEAADMLDQAVHLCLSCRKTDQCAEWLAEHAGTAEAPDYCRNRDLFDRLAD